MSFLNEIIFIGNYLHMIMYKFKCFLLIFCSIVLMIAFFFVSYIKIAFPIAYNNEITCACLEFGVDESLVRAIINVESGYDELAISRVGAKGLMQIMPETAKYIAHQMKIKDFEEKMLFDSKINIRMGTFYLRYLFDKYNDLNLVLFAYNAGEGRLNEYLENKTVLSVENIEIVETRNYIQRVTRQLDIYERLYKITKTASFRAVFLFFI